MEADFYKNARKWYNTLYVNPACERIVYFLLFIFSAFCLYTTYQTAQIIIKNKNYKSTYILLMEHKDKDSFIKINKMPFTNNSTLSLLEVMLKKYVSNYETLIFSGNKTGIDAINEKSIIIKNLSGKDVYDKYISNIYNDGKDMSLAILKIQKTINIKKIEFIYDDLNIVEKLYSYLSTTSTPKGAKVYFTAETTNEMTKKKKYIANIMFDFYIDSDKKANTKVEFKVNDYFIESVKEQQDVE